MPQPHPLRLHDDYLLIADREVEQLAGGDTFWTQLDSDASLVERVSAGWLVGEYPTQDTWDHWEMHPHGDEIVHLVSGAIDVHLDADESSRVHVKPGQTVVIPAGTWHTVTVHRSARLFNITWAHDTTVRPRLSDLACRADQSHSEES